MTTLYGPPVLGFEPGLAQLESPGTTQSAVSNQFIKTVLADPSLSLPSHRDLSCSISQGANSFLAGEELG